MSYTHERPLQHYKFRLGEHESASLKAEAFQKAGAVIEMSYNSFFKELTLTPVFQNDRLLGSADTEIVKNGEIFNKLNAEIKSRSNIFNGAAAMTASVGSFALLSNFAPATNAGTRLAASAILGLATGTADYLLSFSETRDMKKMAELIDAIGERNYPTLRNWSKEGMEFRIA